jgi:hypothetical protein
MTCDEYIAGVYPRHLFIFHCNEIVRHFLSTGVYNFVEVFKK